MKQIAGRAGRYGTTYSEGIVTTLHAADGDYLRHCLRQPDLVVRAAGVFPSREQLELLGALLDNHVTESHMLMDFWEDWLDQRALHVVGDSDSDSDSDSDVDGSRDFTMPGGGGSGVDADGSSSVDGIIFEEREGSVSECSSASMSVDLKLSPENIYSPQFVRRHFPSMRVFSQHLADFMRTEEYAPSLPYSRWGGGGRVRERVSSDSLRFPQTPLSTLLGVFKNSVTFPKSLRTTAVDATQEDSDIPHNKKKNKKKKLKSKSKSKSKKKGSEGSGCDSDRHCSSSLYFVGDLDETRQVAEVLESVLPPLGAPGYCMTFRDQYVFSLAPVNVDNAEVVRALRVITERYLVAVGAAAVRSSEEVDEPGPKVRLPKKYLKISR